ncbi:zinc-dependent alcohol dehydrogenase family protein [Rathayibacter toxicus]|uniref:zinc-dependent alcohol dehydrogenase family protein n=1 Tax=Rathayibacter toxicus TaxID=145458 RepID=UPI001C04EB34|nr:zinc-dependent alcohol dehydrogenase family protein [Rathayibacter toxicus]QWL29376.1 IMP dehydrogenase [Rathayibacter toxicus]
MRATVIHGTRDIRLEEVPDPQLVTGRDAIVRITAACVCGSDLWSYRGVTPTPQARRIGHEFVGVVEAVGDKVSDISVGDFVIAPFYVCDGTCANCLNGVSTSCRAGGWWGGEVGQEGFADGGQGDKVRVPLADGTLFRVGADPDPALIPSLLTLADVMGTGHHAAVSAGVSEGSVVAVVGDGAVGLCAVLAARRLGAANVISMSRHEPRQVLAKRFGATHIVDTRGAEGVARVRELTGGIGADCVLECVGTKESMQQALDSVRPGGMVGYVGVPNGGPELPVRQMFDSNIGVRGGVAPVRSYMAQLLPDVLDGSIEPGLVFDLELPLDNIAEAYAAMDERRAIKSLVRP